MNSIIRRNKIRLNLPQTILSLLSGILTAIAFTFTQLDWFIWFSLVPLFFALYNFPVSGKTGFQISFIFSLTYYLGLLSWLFRLHPLTWVGFTVTQSILLITAGWFTFSFIESLGLSVVGFCIGKFKPRGWDRIILPTSLWIIIEWFQAQGDPGFTWGRLAMSQFQNITLIQSSNLFGSLFISALIVMTNAILATSLIDYLKDNGRFSFKPIVTMIITLIVTLSYGYYHLLTSPIEGKAINVSIAQANILSDQKWNMKPRDIVDNYLDLSFKDNREKKNDKTDLMVWPESAIVDYYYNNSTLVDPEIFKRVKNYTKSTDTYLLSGIFTIQNPKAPNQAFFNSIIGIAPDGKVLGTYSKHHLVPFGEYLPFRNVLEKIVPSITHMNALGHDVTPGTDPGIITTPYGKIGSFVCYDSIIPKLIYDSVNAGAELLVLSTNDSWYKDSMGVYQHNAQSVFRSVETDRYMVRAANTGISSIINPVGQIQTWLPPLVKGTISGKVYFRKTITLYSQIGDFIAILGLLALVFIFFRSRRVNRLENI
ncbi:MAG: apolipoprotein N-acyltransferase [Candidatus Sericytochromatia bacterium]|nr:apolipoprotein N-acyltransferase [Candidatus Sericytochromatia bacterium]